MRLSYDAKTKQFAEAFSKVEENIARALTSAVRDAAKLAVAGGRSNIATAGFSGRFVTGLRYRVTPASGVSLSPEARIFHRFGFMAVFEHGASISGSPLLWLPLDNVPKVKGRSLTARQFSQRFGRLVMIRRAGKAPLLGARVPVSRTGKVLKLTSSSVKPGKKPGRAFSVRVVPMFVGVPKVSIRKRLDIEGITKRAADLVGSLYDKNLKVN